MEKMRFFGHFSDFSGIQKVKKTSKWTEKNEHQRFFSCFLKNESMRGLAIFKNKTLVFFGPFLDRFSFTGRCSRVFLTFTFSVSVMVTIPLVFFTRFFCL
jgi:hypothetical protein